ncbi:hypothetical protein [Nitrospirillum viridazoti]|uniref:Uncharacterized protein n=1 Tax=Nitrospirillum viridazoti CBAmc TaxID=1441467 RepID=A0A248JUZ9_9PROT|nr:hypothetical protein [Nitrospirillum amazonense]ASG22543.1 hypothetical protein Y958_16565 [Nitrospirillum amazonense CBAmc]TWB42896.1 hypothetical protein FBZ91_102112 [Nitrospirillum amazonense]
MTALAQRWFRVSGLPTARGLACNDNGVSLAGIPLLRQTVAGFEPQPAAILQPLIAAAYGVSDPDVEPLIGRLRVVARALNDQDGVRTRIAAVHLALPDVDDAGMDRLFGIRADLAKYDPAQPRDWHGRWTSDGSETQSSEEVGLSFAAWLAGNEDYDNDPDEALWDIDYPGTFHDKVVKEHAALLRSRGAIVITEVRILGVNGLVTRADILALFPGEEFPTLIEVKTGRHPPYTYRQKRVYPLAQIGGHVTSYDQRVRDLGLKPGMPFPALTVMCLYQKNANSWPHYNEFTPGSKPWDDLFH